MSLAIDVLALWLLHSAAVGGLLLLVTCLLLALVRQPARRQRLGEAGVGAALLGAALCAVPGWSLWTWQIAPAAPPRAVTESLVLAAKAPEPALEALFLLPEANGQEGAEPHPQQPAVAPPPLPPAQPAPGFWPTVAGVAVLCHGAGVSFFLLRLLLSYAAVWWTLRRTVPAPAEIGALWRELYPGERAPRLRMSWRLRVPLSCGLWRSSIVLPAALCAVDERARLCWVLAHERAHVRRWDAWSCLLLGVAQALFFHVPWFWLLRWQIRLCQEYVADAAASGTGPQAADYAELLLSFTGSPRLPAAATGVSGRASDLSRRVTMLLQNRLTVELRCPRGWLVCSTLVLLALAVVAAGIEVRAQAAQDAPKEPPSPTIKIQIGGENANPPAGGRLKLLPGNVEIDLEVPFGKPPLFVGAPRLMDLEKALDKLKDIRDPEELQKELRKVMQEMRKQHEELLKQHPARVRFMLHNVPAPARLGIDVEKPSAVLAEQINLPKDRGLVVTSVYKGSAAEKAGFKANDILLEVDARPVPNQSSELAKLLSDLKQDQAVDVLVLRKGRKETIKGVTVPENAGGARFDRFQFAPFVPGVPAVPGVPGGQLVPGVQVVPFVPGVQVVPFFRGDGVHTNITRNNDRFTVNFHEGKLNINITGTVADSKAKVNNIQIVDGGQANMYESVDKVPAAHREIVSNLLEAATRGNIQIQGQKKEQE